MIERAGVVGAGTMGVGIAYVLAAAGIETTVVEPDGGRAAALFEVLGEQAARGVERGKLDADAASAIPARVSRVADIEGLPPALDLVVESVPEKLELKARILAAAEAREPAILATNTSSLSIDSLAAPLRRPGRFLGMHFFNPVWSLGLVELIRGAATDDPTVDFGRDLATRIGKQAIVVRDVPGFATSRLDFALSLEAIRMLEDGVATAEDIEDVADQDESDRLDEGLEETFPASDPVSAKHIT